MVAKNWNFVLLSYFMCQEVTVTACEHQTPDKVIFPLLCLEHGLKNPLYFTILILM